MPEEVMFTVLGAALGVGGGLIKSQADARLAAKAFAREHAARIETERQALQRAAYLRLMTHARELRFVSRRIFQGKPAPSDDFVDDLKARLSNAWYEVAILAPPPTVQLARQLRWAVFDYWSGARDSRRSKRKGEALRTNARDAHNAFENHVRHEFESAAPAPQGERPAPGHTISDA